MYFHTMVSSPIWESKDFEIENRDIMVLVDNFIVLVKN